MNSAAEAAERLQLGGNRRAFGAERRHLLQEVEELDADDPGGADRRAGLAASEATSPSNSFTNSVVVSRSASRPPPSLSTILTPDIVTGAVAAVLAEQPVAHLLLARVGAVHEEIERAAFDRARAADERAR